MKKSLFVIITFLCTALFKTEAQTVNVSYLNPTTGLDSQYKYYKFGNATDFYAGFMWNNNDPGYGDGDDFTIYTYASRDLVLQAFQGNIIMFPNVQPGKVGIGTESPSAKLSIRGQTSNRVLDAYSTNNSLIFMVNTSNGHPFIDLYDGGRSVADVKIATNGNSYFRGGNLGIGTTTPDGRLHIYNATGVTRQYIESGDNSSAGIHIKHNGHLSTIGLAHGTNLLKINNSSSFDHNHLVVAENGHVGVGTNSPYKLLTLSALGEPTLRFAQASTGLHDWEICPKADGGLYFKGGGNGTGTDLTDLLVISPEGNVGIGTTSPGSKLVVNGKIDAKEVNVTVAGWPDFVFEDGYDLFTIEEVEKHIQENKRLPGIPSANEVKKDGVDLGEMDALLLQKIEELTLHVIRQEKAIKGLQDKNRLLEMKVAKLQTK